MKFREFRKAMKKGLFTWQEARIVAFGTTPGQLRLQLHTWKGAGEIVPLRRGVYAFADARPEIAEIALTLCSPSYISLEYALNHYGLLPDIPFGITLVTTRQTQKFNTPFGQFTFQKIKRDAFSGFNPKTLLAEREKALADYLYLHQHRIVAEASFFDEMRWQNLEAVRFSKARRWAKLFRSKKLVRIMGALEAYAPSRPAR